jgi:hypothetical protein
MMEDYMAVTPIAISYLDDIDIPNNIIKKCKDVYEEHGKTAMYRILNKLLFSNTPSILLRNFFIYRKAMRFSKDSYENSQNQDSMPIWMKGKWSFNNKSTTVMIKNIKNIGYKAEYELMIDEYDKEEYYTESSTSYGVSGVESFRERGGSAVINYNRFDFEYKYSSSSYFQDTYKRYVYSTFERIFSNITKNGLFNNLSKDETELLYAVLSSLDDEIKIDIIKHTTNYILFQNSEEVDMEILKNNMTIFLSSLHDSLLLPFKFVVYIICALINPRHEAVIEDTNGAVSTHFFGGVNHILPTDISFLGPSSKPVNKGDLVSAAALNVPSSYSDDITLYENYYILQDQDYNISCWSYKECRWVENIPLTNKSAMPINTRTKRKLIKILHGSNESSNVLWFIFQSLVITYNLITHSWVESEDGNPFNLYNFDLNLLFKNGNTCKCAEYDKRNNQIIFIDNDDNIASYSAHDGGYTSYDGEAHGSQNPSISYDADSGLSIIPDIKNISTIEGYSRIIDEDGRQEYKTLYIIFNDSTCQLIEYRLDEIIVSRQFDYTGEDSRIIDVVALDDNSRFYIIFDNQKIIEFNMYNNNTLTIQKKKDGSNKAVFASKAYINLNDLVLYATDNNALNLVHIFYGKGENISSLPIPLKKYITGGAYIKDYKELFIYESSISLLVNSHYKIDTKEKLIKPFLDKLF